MLHSFGTYRVHILSYEKGLPPELILIFWESNTIYIYICSLHVHWSQYNRIQILLITFKSFNYFFLNYDVFLSAAIVAGMILSLKWNLFSL